MTRRAVFLYAGPTLARARRMAPGLRLDGIDVRPPIKRGDLPELRAGRAPGTLILVDGLFHFDLAVGHAELRETLAAGWTVWGLSSMGAIRARELAALGMRGFGRVHDLFCREDHDTRDDEVTLLHGDAPDYPERSEPLVHIREALAALGAGELAAADHAAILAELEAMWFGDRTLAWLADRLAAAGLAAHRIQALVDDFDRYRVKSWDLLDFLRVCGITVPGRP